MKVSIERDELLKGVNAVLDIVPSKSALPVLSNILLEGLADSGLKLTATDLDISVICNVAGAIQTPGATTVPARKFAEIIRELPDEQILISSDEGRVTLERESGSVGTYSLMSVPAEDFPELPGDIDGPEVAFGDAESLNEDLLKDMVSKTIFAVSRDETRPVLNGVFWQLKSGDMTMVATDGARLVKYSKALSDPELAKIESESIVPPRALNHLVKLVAADYGLQKVTFGQSHVVFTLADVSGDGGIELYSRLIEGPYVDYGQVIPERNGKLLTLNNQALSPAMRRVSILSSSQTHQVRLKVDGNQVELSANSQEIGGAAREVLDAEYGAEEMEVGYNGNYLLDILRRIDSENVVFELDSPVTASIVRPSEQPDGQEYICLIMPLRLND